MSSAVLVRRPTTSSGRGFREGREHCFHPPTSPIPWVGRAWFFHLFPSPLTRRKETTHFPPLLYLKALGKVAFSPLTPNVILSDPWMLKGAAGQTRRIPLLSRCCLMLSRPELCKLQIHPDGAQVFSLVGVHGRPAASNSQKLRHVAD